MYSGHFSLWSCFVPLIAPDDPEWSRLLLLHHSHTHLPAQLAPLASLYTPKPPPFPPTTNLSAALPSPLVLPLGNQDTPQSPRPSPSVMVQTHCLVSTLQTLTFPSRLPLSKYSPVWLQDKLVIHASWPLSSATASPDRTSYSVMRVESPAAASSVEPGEKRMVRTARD